MVQKHLLVPRLKKMDRANSDIVEICNYSVKLENL